MAIFQQKLGNQLVLLAEPMPWLESAAFALLVPAGCGRDPSDRLGLASLTSEMVQRGCGSRDSRRFLEDLELLGADTSSSVANAHASFGGAMPAESLFDTLRIYADVVQRPHLAEDQLDDARQSCIQEVRAIDDDLAQQVMQTLRRRHYPEPFGRSSQGTVEGLEQATLADVRRHFEETFVPSNAILSVAGKFDWPSLRDHVESCFGSWANRSPAPLAGAQPIGGYQHLAYDSTQTHIGVAYESVPYSHPDYYDARAAIGVLSDGMSSRLFTEVREKRGLCYTVYAYCHSLRDRGSVIGYAGTTTERAQETFDVMLAEFRRLSDGITDDELGRLKAKLKSSLIMQQESSPARSGAMASDWYHLGRIQTMDELAGIVDGLSASRINDYLARHRPDKFSIVTLGAKELALATS